MSFDFVERRQHPRIDVVRAIFIEVVQRGGRVDDAIVRCETVDISVGGLRLRVPTEIEPGSRLNIAVPMEDWKENLELAGEAMWCRPTDTGDGYWVGLELGDTTRDNMARWCRVVHQLSPRD